MFKIVTNTAGDLPFKFPTEQAAWDYLEADEYYEPGDMTIWIEEAAE